MSDAPQLLHPTTADAPSPVIAASHVLVVELTQVDEGAFVPTGDGMLRRQATLSARLEQTLKGALGEPPGTEVTFEVTQLATGREYVSPTISPDPWQRPLLGPGQRFVAFCRGPQGTPAAELVRDAAGGGLLEADHALPTLRLVLQAEAESWDAGLLLEQAQLAAAEFDLHPLLWDFLLARFRPRLISDPPLVEGLAALLEHPALEAGSCSALIGALVRDHGWAAQLPLPPASRARLALALLRVAANPLQDLLHDNLVRVWLPQLLEQGHERWIPAELVFEQSPEDRAPIVEALRSIDAPAEAVDALLAWLSPGAPGGAHG